MLGGTVEVSISATAWACVPGDPNHPTQTSSPTTAAAEAPKPAPAASSEPTTAPVTAAAPQTSVATVAAPLPPAAPGTVADAEPPATTSPAPRVAAVTTGLQARPASSITRTTAPAGTTRFRAAGATRHGNHLAGHGSRFTVVSRPMTLAMARVA